jgi:dephospho-CoA kinase
MKQAKTPCRAHQGCLRIALTGGIGSGKSTVSSMFAALGVPVIDADVIAREMTEKDQRVQQAIVAHFGEGIVNAQGRIDRKKLRTLIFAHAQDRDFLESLLHPAIRHRMISEAEKLTAPYCLLVVPLLIEKHWQTDCDRVLVVDTPIRHQIQRIEVREKMTHEEIIEIIRTQTSRDERLNQADDVIHNMDTLETLRRQVVHWDKKYKAIAAS